jgi:hypothetical protein
MLKDLWLRRKSQLAHQTQTYRASQAPHLTKQEEAIITVKTLLLQIL